MSGMITDQYVTVDEECPISTDFDAAAGSVAVNLGPKLGHGNTLRITTTDEVSRRAPVRGRRERGCTNSYSLYRCPILPVGPG